MEQITLRLPADVLADVEEEAEEAGTSRSEYLRDVIESRNEHAEDAERIREEADELRIEVERLRREKRQILDQRKENQELVAWADKQRDLQEAKESAPIWTRTKWWVLGRNDGRD